MKTLLATLAVVAAMFGVAQAQSEHPTIVLVHGAFADSSSWNGVAAILDKDGYTVIAAANPLRGVKADGDYVAHLLASLKKPVILVGHSYGGSVISEAADGEANVKALVYVSAFAPAPGESAAGLAGKFPGSTLGPTLAPPVDLADGGHDLYIQQEKFHEQFAADVPKAEARLMALTQRPVTEAALNEPQGKAAWTHIPSWFIYGDADRNIPPRLYDFMASRAHARRLVKVAGASHVVMVSHPQEVADLIEAAAREVER
ncbi:acetoin dehydrogenase E2 subunit dihydrolipoyllysine-residue acetyltransferase [Hartmannibacter diazotrophicus]|uniref:Acetoin dehydrogenase E2 subunit dihydrolipoyllysine-residue acetyltransferase n=1 Tax=Hartmannibacter diazotrophicus TaxID=1482074 RepID=A0A2C9D504_9HYPH|nr:alpha/beta hydrolase [Hartmannibacter diazotrophicus]SON55407.1 acetoin dehydrogenase E2 subunit dihydrolipoyllysine-residue acetyltransferase [Hartmannibacter diazotrophicus]